MGRTEKQQTKPLNHIAQEANEMFKKGVRISLLNSELSPAFTPVSRF